MADLPYSPDGLQLISNLADPLLPPRLPDDVTAGWMTPPTNHGGWADSQWNADNTDFWSLPIGASPGDILAGYDELGNPIYQTITGQRYQLNAAPQKQGSVVRALAETAMNQPVTDSIGAVAKALAQGAWDTFSLPGRAAAGEPVTYGDVRDFVGDYGVMGAFGAAPEGALRSGAIRTSDDLRYFDNFDDLRDAVRDGGDDVFLRWSRGPEYDMMPGASSRDYQTGDFHEGLSALHVDRNSLFPESDIDRLYADADLFRAARDYSYLQGGGYENNAPHLYFGKSVGIDSDGAPSIRPKSYIGTLSPRVQELLLDDTIPERLSLEAGYMTGKKALNTPNAGAPIGFLPHHTPESVEQLYRKLLELGGTASSLFARGVP